MRSRFGTVSWIFMLATFMVKWREARLVDVKSKRFGVGSPINISCACEWKTLNIQRGTEMTNTRSLKYLLCWFMLLTPLIYAQDLSSYRDFQFGMSLASVAKQTGMEPSKAKMLHQRPALIQELWWTGSLGRSSSQTDPVRDIIFVFYNDKLFRIVVTYDCQRTEGLTNEDMIEAISAQYGAAANPIAEIIIFSSSEVYNDSEKVFARWEDAQYSFNLFRYSYQPTFGMVAFSKPLDFLAQAAIMEGFRLDKEEAPQRELERQEKEAAEDRISKEKARAINKATIRP